MIIKKRISVNFAIFIQKLSVYKPSQAYQGLKRTKSSKFSYNNKINSYSPYHNNMSFNNCSFIHYSTSKNNLLPQKPKSKITTKSMLVNKQSKLMSKIKKEHNIKFKSKSNLNHSFITTKMKLNEININQEDNSNVPYNMIEIEYENLNDISQSYLNQTNKNNSIYYMPNSINSLRYPES